LQANFKHIAYWFDHTDSHSQTVNGWMWMESKS